MRFRVRTLMIAVAAVATLTAMTTWVNRCLQTRDEARRQVFSLRMQLLDADMVLDLREAIHRFDPGDQTPVAPSDDADREAKLAESDQLRQAREDCRTLLLRWQRLADHPWERRPADFPRID